MNRDPRTSWPEPRHQPTPTYTAIKVEGNGPFPIHAMIQCDGFFDTNEDWLSARNSRLTRTLGVTVPPERMQDLRDKLKAESWRVL